MCGFLTLITAMLFLFCPSANAVLAKGFGKEAVSSMNRLGNVKMASIMPYHPTLARSFSCVKSQSVACTPGFLIPHRLHSMQTKRIETHLARIGAIADLPNILARSKMTEKNNWSAINNSNESADETSSKEKSVVKSPKKKKSGKKIVLQRIDKVLADRGLGTRTETFALAKAKRITTAPSPDTPHEERRRLKGPSDKVHSNAVLFLDGKIIPGPSPLMLVYHKPKYVLSVMEDDKKYLDQQRKHLGQMLEPRYARSGMHPVGRLDYDTTGLILFSSFGKLTQALLHPKRRVEKEYVATVQGMVDKTELENKLTGGVETSEGVHVAKLIEVTSSDGPLSDVREDGQNVLDEEFHEEEKSHAVEDYSGPYSDVRLVVTEGKYRMVRRMLANCGHPVVELRRERHGNIWLKDLKVGEFRELSPDELDWAESLV